MLNQILSTLLLINYKPVIFHYICFKNDGQREQLLTLVLLFRFIEQWNRYNQQQAAIYLYLISCAGLIVKTDLKYAIYPVLYSNNVGESLTVALLSYNTQSVACICLYYLLFTNYTNMRPLGELSQMTEYLLVSLMGFEQRTLEYYSY